jgi:hypothetical protein
MLSLIVIAVKVSLLLTVSGLALARMVRKPDAVWIKTRLLPMTVILFASGLLLPSVWLYWLLICALIPIMARTSVEACCLYVLTIMVTPLVMREMIVGGINLLPFDKWLFAAIGLGIAILLRRSRKRTPVGYFDLPFILAAILELVPARGLNVTSTLRVFTSAAVPMIFPYAIISRSMRNPEDMRRLVFTIAFAAFILSCEAVYEWRTAFLPYEMITRHLDTMLTISSYSKLRSGAVRAAASFPESTGLGLFLAAAFLAMLASRPSFRSKRYWMVGLGVILAGIYATNARSPAVALIIAVLASDLYRKRYGAMIAKIAIIAAAGLTLLSAAQFSPRLAERLGVSGASVDTADYREALLRRGTEQILKHPWTGVSVTQTYRELDDLRQGEGIVDFVNAYMFYGMVAGVWGILLMLLCFFGVAANMMWIRRRLRRLPGGIPTAALVFGTALFTIFVAFTSGYGGKNSIFFYVILAIGSALNARPRRAPSRPVDGEEDMDEIAPPPARPGQDYGNRSIDALSGGGSLASPAPRAEGFS